MFVEEAGAKCLLPLTHKKDRSPIKLVLGYCENNSSNDNNGNNSSDNSSDNSSRIRRKGHSAQTAELNHVFEENGCHSLCRRQRGER